MTNFDHLVRALSWYPSILPRVADRASKAYIKDALKSDLYDDTDLNKKLSHARSAIGKRELELLSRDPECFNLLLKAVRIGDVGLIDYIRNKSTLKSIARRSATSKAGSFLNFSGQILCKDDSLDANSLDNIIFDALKYIRSCAPLAINVIHRFVSNIEFIKSSEIPMFTSASNNGFHRRIQIINFSPSEISIFDIVEAIVHESIHSFIYSIELEVPLVYGESIGSRITSPWTGTGLSIHSYLHACFVWFSLSEFWHRAQAHHNDKEETYGYVDRAEAGFRVADITEPLLEFERYLSPGVIKCIDEIRQKVNERAS